VISRDHAYRMLAWRLKQAGIESASLDARVLVQAACRASDIEMIREPGVMLTADQEKLLAEYEERRLAHEPVSRILGRREFWGLDFEVTAATLDPRPDSETLVEAALDLIRDVANPRILDIGTGTGCLLIALLHERKDASGVGVDLSAAALEVARRNAERLGVASRAVLVEGAWCGGLQEAFDLVISNPPYIERDVIAGLEPEVRLHDPVLALDGGPDGLDAYRRIIPALAGLFGADSGRLGLVAFEVGEGQAGDVSKLLFENGFSDIKTHRDLAEIERCVTGLCAVSAGPKNNPRLKFPVGKSGHTG